MRQIVHLNYDWDFKRDNICEKVNIPHCNAVLPQTYFNESIYEAENYYSKHIYIEKRENTLVKLRFHGVSISTYLHINGQFVGEHHGGWDIFEFDVTKFITQSKEYFIEVKVDSFENENIPPFGNMVDFLTYGGIYREVELEYMPSTYIENAFIYPTYNDGWFLNVEFAVTGEFSANIHINGQIFKQSFNNKLLFSTKINNVKPWDIENPNLYDVKISLLKNGQIIDEISDKIGFRIAQFKKDGFYLNFKKLKLIGLNRHQSYADVGYAMPKSMQIQDADILKYDLALNIVRTSHYPQSKHFIRRCDEIGLLVFTEIIGWQHISENEGWRNLVLDSTKNMILSYRNHPSIIIWGVRVNESQDNEELYTKTNAIAHSLDKTRSTGGVRFIEKSQLLEDVYTFNDFSHSGKNDGLQKKAKVTSDANKAYLVTENMGHTFPTKTFDNEEHRTQHALRHLNVIESCYKYDDIAGSIGWCMNDYHTHKDFCNGDGICHHGVLNIYRMPKTAAAVFASMGKKPYLEMNTNMKIGEHPAGNIKQIIAFTNCDYIKLYKNGTYINTFTRGKKYKHVPNSPIFINDLIGDAIKDNEKFSATEAQIVKHALLCVTENGISSMPLKYKLFLLYMVTKYKLKMKDLVELYGKYMGNWGLKALEYTFEGYTNDEKVIEKKIAAGAKLNFDIKLSSDEIIDAETYDVIQLTVQAIDQNGIKIPYLFTHVNVSNGNCHEVIGTNRTMVAGQYSCYIKSNNNYGKSTINIEINGKHFEKHIEVKKV